MKNLSGWPVFCIIFLFQLGSNVIFGYAGRARQDAWIVAMISTIIGCGLMWMYSKFPEWYPGKSWMAILTSVLGRYVGQIVAILYIAGLIYDAGRVLRDFSELIHMYFLPHTPSGFTMFLFLAVVAYGCFAGLGRIANFAELYIPIIFLFLITQIALLVASNVIDFSLLTPVATNWKRIGTAVFPLSITVPFGETLLLTIALNGKVQASTFRKSAIRASLAVGLILMILDVAATCVLGPDVFSRSFYPLLSTFQMIELAGFVENVDPLVVSSFLIGGFFKILIFFYAACTTIGAQWKLKSHRSVIVPTFVLIWLLAIYMADNITSHLFIGWQWATWIIWFPLCIVIPLLVLAIGKFRNRIRSDIG